MNLNLSGKDRVVLVTGASRGVGRGIAIALGATGSTVYVTGRHGIDDAAKAIAVAGGVGIGVTCDHRDDKQVERLFERIGQEQGRLDILVNNAAHVSADIATNGPFWQRSTDLIDMMDVGVRSSYMASFYGAPLLLKSNAGLLVNTSGYGGGCYLHGPAYGACKAAIDKMAADMGLDFLPYGVCAISLWMGLMRTEHVQQLIDNYPETWGKRAGETESPAFVGRVIDALQRSPCRMSRSAGTWIATELGLALGVREDDGSLPVSKRKKFGGPLRYNPPHIKR